MQPDKQKTWWGSEPRNIIVRMPNWLGDLVMATPVLADLRQRFPHANITAMCVEPIATLLEQDPHIDQLFRFRRINNWIHHFHSYQILEPLRHNEYDLGVLLTNSLSSAWWFWRGKVQHRLGYIGHWRRLLLNKALSLPANHETQHLVLTYKQLLEPLAIPLSNSTPALYISDEEMSAAHALLANNGVKPGDVIIGVNPGAAFGSAKCWLPDRYREVAASLSADPKHRMIFFGDPAGTPLVNDICNGMPDQVINLAGKTTIRELAALIKCCRVLLTNDSGPMHMAAALGVPPLALFGSTNDVKTGPYGLGRVLHKHVECSPCYKRVCPIDFRCMKRIEVEEVLRNLREMLQE